MKQIGLIVFIIFLQLALYSQDINVILPHYLTSTHLNPAFTGLHESRYRFSLRAQDEWLKPSRLDFFNHYQVAAEMKIVGWKRDQLSAGMEVRHAVLGSSKFASTAGVLSLAYTRQIFGTGIKRGGHFISFGAEYGFGQNTINATNLIFGDQIDPTTGNTNGNPTQDPAGIFRVTYGDLSAGLLWYWMEEKRFDLAAGVAAYHLNRPNVSMLGDQVSLYMRWNGFLTAGIHLTPKVKLEPGLIMHWQGPHSTMFTGSNIRFGVMDTENFSFKTGLWFQGNERDNNFNLTYLHFLVSLGMQKWDVSLGYGLNLVLPGELINDFRGLSLSMQYYFGMENQRYKLACPRF